MLTKLREDTLNRQNSICTVFSREHVNYPLIGSRHVSHVSRSSKKYFGWTLSCLFFASPTNLKHGISAACIIFASQNFKLALNHEAQMNFQAA